MESLWKTIRTEDGREILFALYRVEDINEAYEKSGRVIHITQQQGSSDRLNISLSSRDLMITLEGNSKEHIGVKDWEDAKKIELALLD